MTPAQLDTWLDRLEETLDHVVRYASWGEREFGIEPVRCPPLDPFVVDSLTQMSTDPKYSDDQRHRLDRWLARTRALSEDLGA